jgi:uncharacterized protein (DUF58 family)
MIRITGPGWAYLIMTLLLGLVAVNTGNNLIYLVESAFLAALAVSGLFGKRNLSRLRVELRPPEEIFAGAGHPWLLTVTNGRSVLPAFLLRVSWRGATLLIPCLAPGETARGFLTAAFPERGRREREDVRIESRYPFGLFIRRLRMGTGGPVVVFPRPVPSDFPTALHGPPDPGAAQTADRRGHDPEVLFLREYAEGDSVRHIDWKATARTGELKTREMADAVSAPLWIPFDRVQADSLEGRISRVVHWVLEARRRGIPVGLVLYGKTHPPTLDRDRLREMLEDLALLGTEEPDPDGPGGKQAGTGPPGGGGTP